MTKFISSMTEGYDTAGWNMCDRGYGGTRYREFSGNRIYHRAYLHQPSFRNLLLQLILVRDYSNAERILMATGFTPLLVDLESVTAAPRAGGVSKSCTAIQDDRALLCTCIECHHGFFYGLGKRAEVTR